MIRQKMSDGPAPSTLAASSSDVGTESMNPLMRNVLNPIGTAQVDEDEAERGC